MVRKLLIFIYLCLQFWYIATTEFYTMDITRLDCNYNLKYFKSNFCSVKLRRNGSNLMSYGGELIHPLNKTFVDLKLFYRFNKVYKFFAVKFTKNICALNWWRKDYKPDVIESMYFDGLKKYSNFIVPCPFKGNVGVYNFTADALRYPPSMPAGEYRMDGRIYDGENEIYAVLKAYIIVKPKGLHVLKMK